MPFQDTPEGQTHYENDGCGEPAHNRPVEMICKKCHRREWRCECDEPELAPL